MAAQSDVRKEQVIKLANFLRSDKGVPTRLGFVGSRRANFFKGRKLGKALKTDEAASAVKASGLPTGSEEEIAAIGNALLRSGLILRVERRRDGRRSVLSPSPVQEFLPDGYYLWLYNGPTTHRTVVSVLLVLFALAVCMFQLWPYWLKLGVWYLCVTILLAVVGTLALRLLVFFLGWMVGLDVWLLPRLFDEEAPVKESFTPVISVARSSGQWPYRLAGIALVAAFAYWVLSQPADFENFLRAQQTFVKDLYSGSLLTDQAQASAGAGEPGMPSLEELQQELELEHGQDEDLGDMLAEELANRAMHEAMMGEEE